MSISSPAGAAHTIPADDAANLSVSPPVSLTPLGRLAGPASVAAGALILVHQVIGLARGRPAQAETAAFLEEPLSTVAAGLDLIAFVLLALALVGLYERQCKATGTFGLVAFLLAFAGTVLAAGDWWFETFAAPYFADLAPRAVNEDPGGQLLAGGQLTFVAFAAGWVLFGVASLRARVFPRGAAILMIAGGVAGVAAGMAPLQVPLALAVGWIGLWLIRSDEPRGAS